MKRRFVCITLLQEDDHVSRQSVLLKCCREVGGEKPVWCCGWERSGCLLSNRQTHLENITTSCFILIITVRVERYLFWRTPGNVTGSHRVHRTPQVLRRFSLHFRSFYESQMRSYWCPRGIWYPWWGCFRTNKGSEHPWRDLNSTWEGSWWDTMWTGSSKFLVGTMEIESGSQRGHHLNCISGFCQGMLWTWFLVLVGNHVRWVWLSVGYHVNFGTDIEQTASAGCSLV